MRTSVRIAALLVGGALFIGCDNKDKTPPTTPAATPAPTPSATDKAMGAVNKEIDKVDGAAKTEAAKLQAKIPTTKPAMPDMPAMPTMPK